MKDAAPLPDRVAGRYRVERLLGVGGMSRVLAVEDERDGRRLALKQLLPSSAAPRLARTLALFRQEFHVLTQIAHPNVIAVDEYGFDDEQPFFTMELVSGQAIEQLAPLAWRKLCAIVLDLCAPLSLLHARRLVHSDLTARNVLVSDDGVTKLIDFGALATIDETSSMVAGTPPYMAPELVHRQLIDGRVDVFALGALAYYALSGRHAYPARSIRELQHVWAAPPRALSELGVQLPAALDHLIMSMLSLDSAARPLQMAELVQRLCAISGDSADQRAITAHAATPKLVAREPVLEAFKSLHESVGRGAGELICISGAKGMGRSRALDACALEARLSGSLVLRASSDEAANLQFGVFASVLLSAVGQEPELAAPLGAALGQSDAELDLPQLLARPDARQQLDAFWDELTARRTVVLLVDDLTRADLSSVQQLLLLAESAKQRRLLIVVCVGSGDSTLERDLKRLLRMGHTLRLRPLQPSETEQLLRSMFGDMAQLSALAEWVHSAAAGVPAACVELAHYALEHGVVRHRAGQFELARDLRQMQLPRAYDEAITARIRALSPRAREALGALSLLTAFGTLSVPEHAELLGYAGWSQAEALAVLDELQDSQLLKPHAGSYELHSEAVRRSAKQELGSQGARAWHERIGSFYQSRGHARSMVASLHLENAGERERAYEQLLQLDANITGPDDPNIPLGGSPLGIGLHQTMLEHAQAKRSRAEVHHFRRILLELAATSNPSIGADGLDLLKQLRIDAGLDFWESADPELSENQKLLYCLARGHERHVATPVEARGMPVRDSVRLLAQSASVVASICALTFNRVTVAEVVRMLEPLRTLSPALGAAYRLIENSRVGLTRGGRMSPRWNEALDSLATQPEGMRELIWRYIVSNLHCNLAREAAAAGDESAHVHLDALSRNRRRQHQVISLRLLFALAYGRFDEARRLRRELEIAVVASGHEDQLVVFAQLVELELLDACGDLLEIQRLASAFEERARRYPGWLPFAAMARASALMHCDQASAAESVLAAQLTAAPVLQHAAWYALRALRAEAFLLAGDHLLARQLAEEVMQQAEAAGLDMSPSIRAQRVSALASAALGDESAAVASLEPLMREVANASSVRAGQVFETRARVALVCRDQATFARCAARVKEIYSAGGYPGLLAKLERLQAAGRRAFAPQVGSATLGAKTEQTTSPYDGLRAELEWLSPSERAMYLLSLLLADSRANAGKLYRVSAGGVVTLINVQSAPAEDTAVDESVTEYVAHLTSLDEETTRCELHDGEGELPSADLPYAVLPLRDRSGGLHGVALIRNEAATQALGCAPALCTMVAEALERMF